MPKYHVNTRGGMSVCHADVRPCPLGGEEMAPHFEAASIREAYQAYEGHLAKEANGDSFAQLETAPVEVAAPAKVTKTTKTGYALMAKDEEASDDEFLAAAEHGGVNAWRNLAKNPYASAESLVTARANAASNAKLVKDILNHRNYPVSAMTPEEFAAHATDYRMDSDDLTGEQLEAYVKLKGNSGFLVANALKNHNNKVDDETVVRVVGDSWSTFAMAVRANRYPLSGYQTVDIDKIGTSIRSIENSDGLDILTRRSLATKETFGNLETTGRWVKQIAYNPNTSSIALDEIASATNLYDEAETLVAVYENPNTEPSTKGQLIARNETVAALDKVTKLDQATEGGLESLIGSARETAGRSSQQRVIQFNPAEVKRLGLTGKDIDAFVRLRKKNWLFGATYNETSGTYAGYID